MQKIHWTSLVLLCALGLSQGSALAQPGRNKEPQCRPGDRGCERGNKQRNARHPQSYQDSRRADLERKE